MMIHRREVTKNGFRKMNWLITLQNFVYECMKAVFMNLLNDLVSSYLIAILSRFNHFSFLVGFRRMLTMYSKSCEFFHYGGIYKLGKNFRISFKTFGLLYSFPFFTMATIVFSYLVMC